MSFDMNNFENGNNKNLLVMVIDNQGRIIFLNKSMEKFTGHTFQELKELKVWNLYSEEDDGNTLKEHFTHFDSDLFPRKYKGKMLMMRDRWSNGPITSCLIEMTR